MSKIYVNTDFYVRFIVNEDIEASSVTVEYTKPDGTIVTGLPVTKDGNTIQYNVSRATNTQTGNWKFRARVVTGGLVSYTQTIVVFVDAAWT